MTNTGHLVDRGTMTIDANVSQIGYGHTTVEKGGVLNVDGQISGGTVEITSDSLQHISRMNFGLMATDGTGIPLAGGQFQSELDLTGAASLSFSGAHVLAPTYNPYAHELTVKALGSDGNVHQVGAFYLGGSTNYDATQFSVTPDGHTIQFADASHLTA